MAEYIPPDLPPPPGADATPAAIAEWDRRARYAELLSIDRERHDLRQARVATEAHRAAEREHWTNCNPKAAMGEFALHFGPTLDAFAIGWDALDARLGQLAAAFGQQPAKVGKDELIARATLANIGLGIDQATALAKARELWNLMVTPPPPPPFML